MKVRRILAVAVVLGAIATVLALPAVVGAGPDSSATVRYGNLKAGSPFPPAEHDSSFNGEDNIIPRNVTISGGAGASVTFDVDGFHQAVVYPPGTSPGDIEVPVFDPVTGAGLFVNDLDNDLFLGPVGADSTWTPASLAPGKYLMICNVTPHFAFANMYGWITVK